MSYKDDIKTLRDELKVLGYSEIPNVLDIDSEDFSSSFSDMGYTLKAIAVEDEDVTTGSAIGTRLYSLQVTYKAQNSKEYDNAWDKFETLYRNIHELCKSIELNLLEKYQDNQFQYIGRLEFYYGTRTCD